MARRHKKVIWTKQGYSTLDEAVGYVGQDSLTAAQDLLESALDTAESLSIFSERGRIVTELLSRCSTRPESSSKPIGKMGTGPGEFRTPHAIVFDSQGRLIVRCRGLLLWPRSARQPRHVPPRTLWADSTPKTGSPGPVSNPICFSTEA